MDQVAGAKIFWIPVSDKFKVQMRCEAALKASSAADTQGSRNRGRRGGGGGTAVKHFLTQEREKKPSNIKATPVSICTNFSYLHWRLFFSSKLFQLRVFAGGGGLRTVPGVEIPVNYNRAGTSTERRSPGWTQNSMNRVKKSLESRKVCATLHSSLSLDRSLSFVSRFRAQCLTFSYNPSSWRGALVRACCAVRALS